MKKSLTPSVSFLILFPIEKGLRMKQVRLIQIQNPNYEILSLPLDTSECALR